MSAPRFRSSRSTRTPDPPTCRRSSATASAARCRRRATSSSSATRRIGFIAGRTDLRSSIARDAGYRRALADAGIPLDPGLVGLGQLPPGRGAGRRPRDARPRRSAHRDLRRQRHLGDRDREGRRRARPRRPAATSRSSGSTTCPRPPRRAPRSRRSVSRCRRSAPRRPGMLLSLMQRRDAARRRT